MPSEDEKLDDTLMAYADGEFDEARRREIEETIARDPELAARVAAHRALRARVSGAFDPVLTRPVPAALEVAARARVLPFARKAAFPVRAWGAREWGAMAASLVLGAFLSWFLAASEPFESQDGSWVAAGELKRALDLRLASDAPMEGVHIGLTFQSLDGAYCRSFTLRDPAIGGLACREGDAWRIPVLEVVHPVSGDFRQAASPPPAVLAAIDARLFGEPLDAAAERAARDQGWRTSPR